MPEEIKVPKPKCVRPRKHCAKCGKRKDTSLFYHHPRTKDRLQSWCKTCQSDTANERNKRLRAADKVLARVE